MILIPPQYVKPFVKGNKNDFNDAQAIVEAALRPDMKSVPVKTIDQQAMASVHRIRDGFVAERTAVMSRMGSLLLEFGISMPRGHKVAKSVFAWLGLVPRQYSTGGKPRLLGISKRGNKRLRCVIVHGARAIMSRIATGEGSLYDWLRKLRENKPFNKVCVALANKIVRMAFAVLSTRQPYKA